MRPKKLDQLVSNLETQPSEGLDRRIAAMIAQAAEQRSGTGLPASAVWRRIMQSKTAQVAALIAIVLISIVVFQLFDSSASVTWAGVIDPLMTAETAVFNIVTRLQDATIEAKIMVMGQRIRYEMESAQGPPIVIFDAERLEMLTLVPERKAAVLVDMTDLVDQAPENYLASIRNVINELESDPNASIERLADVELDGRNAIVFRAQNDDGEMTVWADPETLLPIRLEQRLSGLSVTSTDFQFDPELDPALFSTEIPAGYSTASSQMRSDNATEEKALEGLRIWAQILEDNQFPPDLSTATYQKMPGLRKKLREGTLTLTTQEKLDMAMKIAPFSQFLATLKPEQDWQYVGGGVAFGDASQPVCWYKPIGSETYRVVFGDLSIKEMPKEDLPK